MAKNMTLLSENVVVNMVWCSDREPETDILKNTGDYPIDIGDTYVDGKWYRDGVELLTPLEEAYQQINEVNTQLDAMEASYLKGVNEA